MDNALNKVNRVALIPFKLDCYGSSFLRALNSGIIFLASQITIYVPKSTMAMQNESLFKSEIKASPSLKKP